VVICLERGANCLHIVKLMPLPSQTPSSLASFKSRLVFTFWLTQVVPEKRPLNGFNSSVVVVVVNVACILITLPSLKFTTSHVWFVGT